MAPSKRICIVGSGNWGSVIAKIVGTNVKKFPGFENRIPMYVYEEMVNGQKLTEIINTKHENVKYLPGTVIPDNVVAVPDVAEAGDGADILIFVVPHQFVKPICTKLKGRIKPNAIAISLIKGVDVNEKGLDLLSNLISKMLGGIECAVLMGANIAPEVARENYCEATIGCHSVENGKMLKDLFQTDYFRIVVVEDVNTVEMCGALKNIVALGAGFVDGMNYGDNTKAAVIRLGLMEMVKFAEEYFQKSKIETFLESCGVADLVTTCYSGRNTRVAEQFVKQGKTITELEAQMLNGQKLQGPLTAAEVYEVLKSKKIENRFPLFTAVHLICTGEMEPSAFISCLKNHPAHM